jgi:phage repressor protein C with HTH and peptisase S24 domain
MGGMSARTFAHKCALSEGAIRSYLSGGTLPTLDRLEQIASSVGVSPVWLAFGIAPEADESLAEDASEYVYVPLYDARVSAGDGSWNDNAKVLTTLAFTKYSIRKKHLESAELAAFRVDGDSNEPILSDGDTVMVDLRRTDMRGDAMYVICMGEHLFVKRLQLQFDGGLQVISVNPAYPPVGIPKDRISDLEIIGRVVWAGGWM